MQEGRCCCPLPRRPTLFSNPPAPCVCAAQGKMFSPGNLRATFDNPAYEKLIRWVQMGGVEVLLGWH